MSRIDDQIIDGLRETLVAVVSERVELRRAGVQLTGCCPFHAERTPSFTVHPEKLVFHCHGCDAGGDVFAFVMKLDGLTFPQAVKVLAERAGSTLVEAPRPPRRAPLLRKCEWPSKESIDAIARDCVPVTDDPVVSAYLEGRAIGPHLIAHLRMGFSLHRDSNHRRARSGHRFVVPLYDAQGVRRSVVFRRVEGTHPAKTMGVDGASARGLVFACPGALAMLRGESWGHLPGERATVYIAEGEIDALTNRQCADDTAVLGVRSGSWSAEIAARIPDGTRVIIGTHHDAQGERYAARIVETLAGRDLELVRTEPWEAAA